MKNVDTKVWDTEAWEDFCRKSDEATKRRLQREIEKLEKELEEKRAILKKYEE